MLTKEQKRNQWMQKFEDKCLETGVSCETIHGTGHTNFWKAANFYWSSNLDVETAVTRYLVAHPIK